MYEEIAASPAPSDGEIKENKHQHLQEKVVFKCSSFSKDDEKTNKSHDLLHKWCWKMDKVKAVCCSHTKARNSNINAVERKVIKEVKYVNIHIKLKTGDVKLMNMTCVDQSISANKDEKWNSWSTFSLLCSSYHRRGSKGCGKLFQVPEKLGEVQSYH